MTTKDKVAQEALKHGFTLVRADMRCGLFFLQRGDEIRTLGRFAVPRNASDWTIKAAVAQTVKYGRLVLRLQ